MLRFRVKHDFICNFSSGPFWGLPRLSGSGTGDKKPFLQCCLQSLLALELVGEESVWFTHGTSKGWTSVGENRRKTATEAANRRSAWRRNKGTSDEQLCSMRTVAFGKAKNKKKKRSKEVITTLEQATGEEPKRELGPLEARTWEKGQNPCGQREKTEQKAWGHGLEWNSPAARLQFHQGSRVSASWFMLWAFGDTWPWWNWSSGVKTDKPGAGKPEMLHHRHCGWEWDWGWRLGKEVRKVSACLLRNTVCNLRLCWKPALDLQKKQVKEAGIGKEKLRNCTI